MGIKSAILKVSKSENLSREEATAAMTDIMSGEATSAQIGGYLMALRLKGETLEEITGSAQAMRDVANHAPVSAQNVIDTCGTGGDSTNTFNISTTVAFVAAGAGIPVAKHGNRSVSSKSGSADVLGTLGVNLSITPEQAGMCVDEVGIGFLFAPAFHPAMKHAIGARRELGVRTIFNILGPLTNPAGAKRQLMGVFDPNLTETLANVLKDLGSERVFVVHGAGGLDELSTLGVNRVSELYNDEVNTYELNPADYGLTIVDIEAIRGGSPEENAEITRDILAGGGTSAQREVVMLNAAVAFVAGGICPDIVSGLQKATEVLDSRAGLARLEALAELTQQFNTEG